MLPDAETPLRGLMPGPHQAKHEIKRTAGNINATLIKNLVFDRQADSVASTVLVAMTGRGADESIRVSDFGRNLLLPDSFENRPSPKSNVFAASDIWAGNPHSQIGRKSGFFRTLRDIR